MKTQCVRWVVGLCAVALLAGFASSQEKDKKGVDVTAPPIDKKGVDVTAPPIDQPPPFPPPPPTPNYLTPTTGASPFDYQGSPFNQFNYVTPTVTGAPVDGFYTPRSLTEIDQTRINERTAGTTPFLFQGIPGLLIQRTNAGGGSVILRGRNGNQNLIMVDGIPINDAGWRFGNVQYLNTIDPGIIERIEVIRGPASVLYGSGAVGGVVNIITKSRKDFSQTMDFGGNIITNFSTALESPYNRVDFQGNFLNFGWYGGGSYFNLGAVHAGQGIDFANDIVSYSQRAADVRLDWLATDIWTVTFDYQHLLQPSVPRTDRFPTPLIDPTRFTNRPTFFHQNRDFGYVRLQGFDDTPGLINAITVTLALQQRREGRTEFDNRRADRMRLTDRFERVINGYVDIRGYTFVTPYNTLAYGTTFIHDSVYASRFRNTNGGPVSFITPSLPPNGIYDQFGIFVTDRQEVTDWWFLNGGIRYTNINAEGFVGVGTDTPFLLDRNFQDWSAEFGSVVVLTDNINWVASISEGFRAPNLDDLATSDRATSQGQDFGAVTLSPERTINYETGLKFRGRRFVGSAVWFYSENPVQIVRVPTNGSNVRANTKGYLRGTEIEGAWFVTDNFSLFTAGSHTYGNDTTLGSPLTRVNPAYLAVGGRWAGQTPRIGLYIEGWTEMMGKQTRLSPGDRNDIRIPVGGTPAWQTVNLRCGIDARQYGQLTLGLYNIFDQHYRIHGSGVDSPGIDFRVNYQLSY
ncbi:MAG: hypothetical protein KatS3mg105_3923 [Gemmatales bacterium]|nr:MAG: hypothetical protein KatS3mg105_3923 [Gemmatales bacterium]